MIAAARCRWTAFGPPAPLAGRQSACTQRTLQACNPEFTPPGARV